MHFKLQISNSEVKFRYQKSSSPEWIATVMSNFDEFLKDHADCERKASAMAMSFVAKYPDRKEMIPDLIETALEELEHFKLVYEIMEQRGIPLPTQMSEDPYIKALLKTVRTGLNERLMDRLLIASVAETRGAERFRMVEEALDDVDLKNSTKCFGLQKQSMVISILKWPFTIFLVTWYILDLSIG